MVKTTSATFEASRLFDRGFLGVKKLKVEKMYTMFWGNFEAKITPLLWHGGTG